MTDLLSNANIQDAETPDDYGKGEAGQVARWNAELKTYEEDYRSWIQRASKMWAIYRGESDSGAKDSGADYNLLWANTRILKPIVYGGTPVPRVQRRHKDKNPAARAAAELLERATRFAVDNYDFDGPQKAARDDWLVPGRGTVWVRFVPDFEAETVRRNVKLQEVETPEPERFDDPLPMDAEGEPVPQFDVLDAETEEPLDYSLEDVEFEGEQPYVNEIEETLVYSEVICEHVSYKDFFHEPASCWSDVGWVAKRVQLTREQADAAFGEEKAKKLKYESRLKIVDETGNEELETANLYGKAEVFEIWYKPERKVYWVSTSYADGFLKEQDDPLGLKGFFPCPRPLFANLTTDTLKPQPDYYYYKSQAKNICMQTSRIAALVAVCRVMGGYNPEFPELADILEGKSEAVLKGVKDFEELAEKGGLTAAIDLVDVTGFAQVLQILYDARSRERAEADDLYGITDIMRGETNPNETYGAQRMKQNNSDLRIREMQEEMARHARDTIALMAEIIAEKFEPDILRQMAGTDWMDPGLLDAAGEMDEEGNVISDGFDAVVELLRNDLLRSYAIDIETDSTIATNDEQEKAIRLEVAEALANLFQNFAGITQEIPEASELFAQVVGFVARAYKGGRELEPALDAAIEGFIEAMNEPEDPEAEQPDPEMLKIQLDQQKSQADFQIRTAEMQFKQQVEMAEMQSRERAAQIEGLKLEMEAQKVANESRKVQLEAVRVELEAKKQELEHQKQQLEMQKTMLTHQDKQAALQQDYYEADLNAQVERETNATRLQDEMIESRAQMAEADAIKSIATANKSGGGAPVTVNVKR